MCGAVMPAGDCAIVVKVIDILGDDTTKTVKAKAPRPSSLAQR